MAKTIETSVSDREKDLENDVYAQEPFKQYLDSSIIWCFLIIIIIIII